MHGNVPTKTRALFDSAPWQGLTSAETGAAARVPTLLSPAEQRLYYWLARHWARGRGAIVDLGCFAGGSTARLAEGRRQGGRGQGILAFDRFTATEDVKARLLYPAGIPAFDGNDILPLVEKLLGPWQDQVTLIRGEIRDAHWSGGMIEILAVEAATETVTADAIATGFFPHLIPGGSVLIQRDYFNWRQPWIAAQMERLAAFFEPVAVCPDTTVVFVSTAVPDHAALAGAVTDTMPDDEVVAALAGARARLARFGCKGRFDRLDAALAANPGVRIASRMVRA